MGANLRESTAQTIALLAVLALTAACNAQSARYESAAAARNPARAPAPAASVDQAHAASVQKVSRFGEYRGYSPERFSEWVRESRYITVRDGTRLAVDVVRPAVNGVAVEEKLPVIWTHARYHRNPHRRARHFAKQIAAAKGEAPPGEEAFPPGTMSIVDEDPMLQTLLRHGYVAASVDVRGSGASFGRYEGTFSEAETKDAYDIIDWLSKQRWSDGKIGMFGGSYLGITQYMAASTHHPALKAIVPQIALIDLYDVLYPGGIYRDDFMQRWGKLTRDLDFNVRPMPVDGDRDERLLEQAIAGHRDNWDPVEEFRAAPLRDHDTESFGWRRFGPSSVLDRIQSSKVASYHLGGFYDAFARDEFIWLEVFTGPDKLAMGPWPHSGYTQAVNEERERINTAEHHRWFDFWLKGIDNGVMDGPAIHYAVTDTPGETWHWRAAETWPPAGTRTTAFFLAEGPSKSVRSKNDGLLKPDVPQAAAADAYEIRQDTSSGDGSRWPNTVSFNHTMSYPDMTANDEKSLTYTTPVLEEDVTVTGSPVATLHISTAAPDADLYALLEEVDASGHSHYVTEGLLRASHRKLARAPWNTARLNSMGLPWHRSFASDIEPLRRGEVTELRFDLHPAAHLFNRGHRLRLTIMGADADNTEPPPAPGSVLEIHFGGEFASRIELPIANASGRGAPQSE